MHACHRRKTCDSHECINFLCPPHKRARTVCYRNMIIYLKRNLLPHNFERINKRKRGDGILMQFKLSGFIFICVLGEEIWIFQTQKVCGETRIYFGREL